MKNAKITTLRQNDVTDSNDLEEYFQGNVYIGFASQCHGSEDVSGMYDKSRNVRTCTIGNCDINEDKFPPLCLHCRLKACAVTVQMFSKDRPDLLADVNVFVALKFEVLFACIHIDLNFRT